MVALLNGTTGHEIHNLTEAVHTLQIHHVSVFIEGVK